MLFALFLGLICQDIIYKRVHNGVKYFFIIPIGILCVMFFLLSTLVAGTDILSYFYQTNIYYGQKLDILFWLVFTFDLYSEKFFHLIETCTYRILNIKRYVLSY